MILGEEFSHKILTVNTGTVASKEKMACHKFTVLYKLLLLIYCMFHATINTKKKRGKGLLFLLRSIYSPRRLFYRHKKFQNKISINWLINMLHICSVLKLLLHHSKGGKNQRVLSNHETHYTA